LALGRVPTFREHVDEAFADPLKKHGIPIELKNALRTSAPQTGSGAKAIALSKPKKR
jgi:hypothetical protein